MHVWMRSYGYAVAPAGHYVGDQESFDRRKGGLPSMRMHCQKQMLCQLFLC